MFLSKLRPVRNLAFNRLHERIRSFSIKKNPESIALIRKVSRTHFYNQWNSFCSKSMKVAVLGASSKTGNCLSLFLKQSSLIDELAIYDNKSSTYGTALELNYIDTRCRVSTCDSHEACLQRTLQDAKVVMIVADRRCDKNSTPDKILESNADILSDLLPSVIRFCPRAMVAIAMSPINSLIPLAMEMYKKAGIYEYSRLFGVMTLDCVRANTFAAEALNIEPECVMVPVIGGSCPETCVPIFSQAKICNKLSQQEISRMTQAVRKSDVDLMKINKSNEGSSFAMGFAAARFCISICKALRHQSGVVECAYVRSCVIPEVTYFAAPLELGPEGVQKHLGVPPLNNYECKLVQEAIPALKKAIARGEALALGPEDASSESCSQKNDRQTLC